MSESVSTERVFRPAERIERLRLSFTRAEWTEVGALYAFITALHVVGWGLFVHYAALYPAMIGLGAAAYLLGLRHAFDSDHIAAVDDTVRFMMQKGKSPLGVGFFFSLGHSSIVLGLAVAITLAATAVKQEMPMMQNVGALIGTLVSGAFLWLIGILNLLVLFDILNVWKQARTGNHSHEHLETLLGKRGLMNRLFGGWLRRVINHSWQMYPVGLLFGLGFDTASAVGLLAMTAGASTSNLPWQAVVSLPLLFASGMSVMDTTDGILMCKAYGWAFANPLRKIYYNITMTTISIFVGLAIGTIELAQVLITVTGVTGPVANRIASIEIGGLGYMIVGAFLLAWLGSVLIWKLGRFQERYAVAAVPHSHEHTHETGTRHAHKHFH